MADSEGSAQGKPGYRRRIRVEPAAGRVLAAMEDDMHCMAVMLRHDGETVQTVEPVMDRAPWDTCPGARAKLVETFAGQPLAEVTARREKRQNCTHLHDLAVLAAAHAAGTSGLVYDISVSDPENGRRILELRRDGELLLRWIEQDGVLREPASLAGKSLMTLREAINAMAIRDQEPARLLQWAGLVAHGRTIPLEQQSRAADLPPNCYSFQPERAAVANRIGKSFDFSRGSRVLLDEFHDRNASALDKE